MTAGDSRAGHCLPRDVSSVVLTKEEVLTKSEALAKAGGCPPDLFWTGTDFDDDCHADLPCAPGNRETSATSAANVGHVLS